MDNNQPLNQNDNKQYLSMVNYLISQLNKAKVNPFPLKNQSTSLPIFLYEFFVFELYLPGELLKFIKQPILAFRLLDFPSLTLEGNLNIQKQSIIFNQGKSSYFEMDSLELKDNLLNQPMYIMFLDLNHGNIKVIGNCRLNISLFAYDSFLNYGKGQIPEPRRNILQLFDNTMEKIGEFEMSLIIRREYYKFDKNIEVKENNKTVVIKKAKKQRKILSKEKRENLMIKGKEKPKEKIQMENEIIYDNNKITNSKYTKPQFVNNILLEKQDTAFNAHPINKEIIIKPKFEEDQKYPEDIIEDSKKKKKKVTKCNKKIGTELIPGVNVPIDKVDYYKKEEKKKKENKKEKKSYNIYKNNLMLINSMYNKYQPDSEYKYPVYELVPNNNNQNYPQSNNINNQINNKNMNYEMEKNQMNQINNNNYNNKNDNLNNNTYLKFLTDLKSKVNDYTNNLLNDKEMLQKIKKERNLNQENNLDEKNINENQSTEKNINTNNNNNIINDSKNKKSENPEPEPKPEKNEDNQIQDNNINNKKEKEKNEEEEIEEEEKEEKKEEEKKEEEKKEDEKNESNEEEEYNDFEASGKTNKSKNEQPKNEILDNKYNNYNAEFEENNEIDTNEKKLNPNLNDELINNNNNNNENNNNIQSDDDIVEDPSLKEKNEENENQINSGEINEEIDENINSTKKEIISGSENKNPASSTEIIENLLK